MSRNRGGLKRRIFRVHGGRGDTLTPAQAPAGDPSSVSQGHSKQAWRKEDGDETASMPLCFLSRGRAIVVGRPPSPSAIKSPISSKALLSSLLVRVERKRSGEDMQIFWAQEYATATQNAFEELEQYHSSLLLLWNENALHTCKSVSVLGKRDFPKSSAIVFLKTKIDSLIFIQRPHQASHVSTSPRKVAMPYDELPFTTVSYCMPTKAHKFSKNYKYGELASRDMAIVALEK
nr:hypothetical protein Iba_chr08bCG10250 [Ipomoea batatas]